MNKNVLIGGGVAALGLFLAYRAKKKGKIVPIIGRFIPTGGTSNFGGKEKNRTNRLWK